MGASAVNYRSKFWQSTAEENWAVLRSYCLFFSFVWIVFFLFFFVLIHYGIDVYALVSC